MAYYEGASQGQVYHYPNGLHHDYEEWAGGPKYTYGASGNPITYEDLPYEELPLDAPGIPEEVGLIAKNGRFLKKRRMQVNICPILFVLLLPMLMFAAVIAVTGSTLREHHPLIFYGVIIAGAFICFIAWVLAYQARFGLDVVRGKNWYSFLAGMMTIAWISAFALGMANYHGVVTKHQKMLTLNTYGNLDPRSMRGQQLMDAGVLRFKPEAHLDLTKAMTFHNKVTYCAVPVTLGNQDLPTYDFWAVDKNCCSENSYRCENANNRRARTGMRLLDDSDRAFYRLAVQQAESKYKIKAIHPLFFRWVDDADQEMTKLFEGTRRNIMIGVFAFVVFAVFATGFAAVAFTRSG